MDNVLGALPFAGLVLAQFLAVVAVSKWNARAPATTDDLHRGTHITASNIRQAGTRIERSNQQPIGRKIMIGVSSP